MIGHISDHLTFYNDQDEEGANEESKLLSQTLIIDREMIRKNTLTQKLNELSKSSSGPEHTNPKLYIIPHLVNLITCENSKNPLVTSMAIKTLIKCLKSMESGDYKIFTEYIKQRVFDVYFEDTRNDYTSDEELIQFTIVQSIGDIVEVAERFKFMTKIMVAESVQRMQMNKNK